MKKAVIFDLDGTLLNTLPTITFYVNDTLKAFGIGVLGEADVCRYIGHGAEWLIQQSLLHFGISDKALFQEVLHRYKNAYDKAPLYLTEIYDGISDLLAGLKERGIVTAVFSNKPDSATVSVVKHFFGEGFAHVQGAKPQVALKPAPEGVFDILGKLGVDKKDCLFVGDTIVDMETGENAGVETVGVLWGFRDREELQRGRANYIVSVPNEILAIAEQ